MKPTGLVNQRNEHAQRLSALSLREKRYVALTRDLAILTANSERLAELKRGRLAHSTRYPLPSGQGEQFNFSRQVITHTRRSSRYARSQTASELRERMRWSITPTDEFVEVCGCLDSRVSGFPTSLWVSEFPLNSLDSRRICGCLDSGFPVRLDESRVGRTDVRTPVMRQGQFQAGRMSVESTDDPQVR